MKHISTGEIMENSTKIKAIIAVMDRRMEICRHAHDAIMEQRRGSFDLDAAYYDGKINGYEEAIELLKSSLESIAVEL